MIVLITTTGRRVRYHLCLLLLVRVGGYIVNLLDFYSYRLIGKLTAFLFAHQVKGKVGLALAKTVALRINLNLDGAPIASKSHTHPSHSV
jgi:hypothetical protein